MVFPGYSRFAPPIDWLVSMSEIILESETESKKKKKKKKKKIIDLQWFSYSETLSPFERSYGFGVFSVMQRKRALLQRRGESYLIELKF